MTGPRSNLHGRAEQGSESHATTSAPIPTELQINEPAPYEPPPDVPGGTGHEEHGWPETWPRYSLWKFAVWIVLAFLLSTCTGAFVSSAAASTASHRDDHGARFDTAAVRADSLVEHAATRVAPIARDQFDGPTAMAARTTSEDPSPASESPAVSPKAPQTTSRDDPAAILAIIRNAAIEFGQDPDAMIAVARCESSLRSDAVGDGGAAVGLFQFHRETFTANARRLFGHEVDEHERLDPVTSSLVAAWMWSIGQRGQWTCAK